MSARVWAKCLGWKKCITTVNIPQSAKLHESPTTLNKYNWPNSSLSWYSSFTRLENVPTPYSRGLSTSVDSDYPTKQESSHTQILSSMYTQNQSTGEDQNQSNDHKKDSQGKGNKEESPFMRSQRYAKWSLLGTVGICTPLFIVMNGKPKTDEEGNEILDEYSEKPVPIAYMKRAWAEVNLVKKDIVEPSSKKLLPDPLEEPYYQPPYTLVIELMDVFLRPVYDSVTGWRFKKRPGIDYFLSQVGPPMYEVVVFTRETGMTAFPLIDSMDSKGYIMYRLFRDSARYQSGFSLGEITKGVMPKLDPYYQKDLKYLNRDLSRVIMVDCDRRACEKQPENGLCLNKWDGDSNDTALFDLAALLRTIATSDVDDVRPILKHYSGYSDPLHAFKLAQARMQQETTQLKEMPKTNSELFARTGSALSSFFRRR